MRCPKNKYIPFFRLFLLSTILILAETEISAQAPKKLFVAKRISALPVIDGKIDEEIWKYSTVADDFTQYLPYNGSQTTEQTEVRLLYDNEALYISAQMFDYESDSVIAELDLRDQGLEGNSDYFLAEISPFNNGINSSLFMVTASGIQTDAKLSGINIDYNWDAIWESAVAKNEKGWSVEIKIPYAALRFPKKRLQVWGVNFMRKIKRKEEIDCWNFIDIEINGWPKQSGELIGILNIEPPLRLSILPYIINNIEYGKSFSGTSDDYNLGLDIKYGINQSFTLDMILIPDFTQVQSDDKQINLTPYEIKYEEKRPFFTESSEIFQKGEIYYSKRVGEKPESYNDVSNQLVENEIIEKNPTVTPLINATKLSGRTIGGLGIGVINAITNQANANVIDTLNHTSREILTQDYTNYTLLVLDKNLKNNSYTSVANTNVYRNSYIANVISSDIFLATPNSSYAISGIVSASFISDDSEFSAGHRYYLTLKKTSGKFLFALNTEQLSNNYNPNDMGYLKRNDETSYRADFNYNIKKPFAFFLGFENRFYVKYAKLYSNNRFFNLKFNYSSKLTFRNNSSLTLEFSGKPKGYIDYIESRNIDRAYIQPAHYYVETTHKSSPKKDFQMKTYLMYWFSESDYNQNQFVLELNPTWRLSKNLIFAHLFSKELLTNDIGYTQTIDDEIFYGRRGQNIIINTTSIDYIFNKKHSLSFRARYYWAQVVYYQHYTLNSDGTLTKAYDELPENTNYNAFNVDAVYQWQFAHGSALSLWWKKNILNQNNFFSSKFGANLNNTLTDVSDYLFSIKLIYYLDANRFRKK